MPCLQFDTTASPTAEEKRAFADAVTELYAEVMETETGHVGVTIRPRDHAEMSLGRADDGALLFLDARIRRGRPFDLKREFATAVIEAAADRFGVPRDNAKVVFTEHEGEEIMGYERVGGSWDGAE
jgi:phenylpyruvate tautomerase PptA (4-oxalocrotonate tautomerase family)